jgi:hypothetical protein
VQTDEVASSARRALRERFGFADVAFGERLEADTRTTSSTWVADGTPLVLRIKHPPVIEDDVAWGNTG